MLYFTRTLKTALTFCLLFSTAALSGTYYYQSLIDSDNGPARECTVSNDLGQTTAYTYDAAGRVITQTLPDNRVIAFEYYADGELKTITPPNGERHVFSYTAMNDTDAYQPPPLNGQASDTVYRYNKDRQLTQIDLPDGSRVSYNYDAVKGRLNSIQAGSLRYDYHYNDSTGELVKLTDAAGNEINITADSVLLDQLDYHGAVEAQIAFAYDDNFRLTENNITLNGQTFRQRYSYTADDLLSTSGELSLTYDDTTRQLQTVAGNGISQSISYNGFASPESVRYGYDLGQYSDTIVLDRDIVTNKVFKVKGQVSNSSIAYVMVGDVRFTPDSQGKFAGSLTLESYSTYLSIRYYDQSDQLLHRTVKGIYYSHPGGYEARAVYRLTADKLYYGDYNGLYSYNANDTTVTAIVRPDSLDFDWRVLGVDAQGVVYYKNRHIKQVVAYQDETLLATYTYDYQSNPMLVTKDGKLLGYRQESSSLTLKRYRVYELTSTGVVLYPVLETEGYPQAFAEDQSSEGALLALTIGYGGNSCGDGCGRAKREVTLKTGGALAEQIVSLTQSGHQVVLEKTHDNANAPLTSLTGSSTGSVCYRGVQGYGCYYPQPGSDQHDFYAVNQLSYYYGNQLSGYGEHGLVTILYENGRYYPQLIDYPGQPAERRVKLLTDVNVPDLQGTLTIDSQGGSNATLYANDYTYDVIGRIKNISEQRQHRHIEHSYTYNNVGKLIEATTDGVTQTWQYDANGNRTHEDGLQVASYDAQDRLTQYKDNSYQYNALGQLTEKTTPSGTETYDYDVFGNLRGVALANGNTIEYLIDPKDRRIGKKVNGTITQKLLYLGQLNPIAELYPDNSIKNLFIYADKSNAPSAMRRYDESGNLTGKYRIISNHLGSVVMVINAETGDIAQEIEYDVWGNVLSDSNPNFQPFYFAGGIYDIDTKLTRFGARDYDAETGRWTAKDPIGFAGGLTSLYDYVSGDPVNWIDPSGNESEFSNNANVNKVYSEMVNSSVPGRETKGRSIIKDRIGNFNDANKWFDKFKPENVKSISDPTKGIEGRVGDLPDGKKIIVRSTGTEKVPTLELQKGKRKIKFRFRNKLPNYINRNNRNIRIPKACRR